MRLENRLGILTEEVVLGADARRLSPAAWRTDPRLALKLLELSARLDAIAAELMAPGAGAEPIDLPQESFRRLRDEVLPNWSSHFLATNPKELVQASGRALFRELCAVLRLHVHFPEEWEYDLAALYVFQCYIADLLPAFFYALIDGTKGAGKTTLLDHLSRLTGALRLQSFTLATLSRSMTKFRPVSIDEFDVTEKNPELGGATAALVRQGYKRDAAPRLICTPRSNEVLSLEIAGPKAITFRYDLDDALQDRGFRFPMAEGSTYRLVVLGMAPEFGDLPARLSAWAFDAHKVWSFESVCQRIKEPSFEVAVGAALGKTAATRGAELMTTALLVSEIAGVTITGSLRAASGARQRESTVSRGVEELMDALRVVAPKYANQLSETEFTVVPQTAVRSEMDRARKERRLLPLKDGEFSKLRRDAHIQDDWRVTIHGFAHWKVPKAFLAGRSGSEAPEAPDTPSPQDDRVPRVARVGPSRVPAEEDASSKPADPHSWQEPAVRTHDPTDSGGGAP